MLDRNKLSQEINALASKIFPDSVASYNLAQSKWQEISSNPIFSQRIQAAKSSFLLPGWQGNLSDIFEIKNDLKEYSVLAVDGSQIYPDRNFSGASCLLINSGGCFLNYANSSFANFFSEPKLFLPDDIVQEDKFAFSKDLVDLKREELELQSLLEKFLFFYDQHDLNKSKGLCLTDGSLIFWHLEGKHPEVKQYFLDRYLYYLELFYKNKILIAGFISFPKSKELVNLIKIGLCRFTIADCISCHSQYKEFPCKAVDSLIDTQVVKFFLKSNSSNSFYRTTLFYGNSKIIQNYPDHLKPCFFYFDVGQEIVRIEIPAWIAFDNEKLNFTCKVVVDQSLKGGGYPVCLAEAHEQAVVKGPDRDFFYHLIYKLSLEQNRRFFISQKSLKKRRIGI